MKELFEKKGRLAAEAQAILDAAKKETRSLTAEEDAKFEAIHADIEQITKQIAREQRQEALRADLSTSQGRRTMSTAVTSTSDDALRTWFETGERSAEQRSAARVAGFGNQNAFVLDVRAANNHQSVANNSEGGYTTQSNLIQGLEEARKAFGGARQFATVIRTDNGNPLPWVTSDETSNEGEMVGEAVAVSNTILTFSRLTLGAYKFSSKAVTVSIELLQDSSFDFAGYVGRKLGERIGRIENRKFTTGAGTTEPTGFVTGATQFSGANAISYDELVNIEHAVDPAYRSGAKWTFKDSTLKTIKKLVDGQQRPLWVPGLTSNAPDQILGYSYIINQNMDDAVANTSALPIAFGASDKFLIRDVKDIVIVRLDELYALSGEVAFVAFTRSDSAVLDAGTHPIVVWAQA